MSNIKQLRETNRKVRQKLLCKKRRIKMMQRHGILIDPNN